MPRRRPSLEDGRPLTKTDTRCRCQLPLSTRNTYYAASVDDAGVITLEPCIVVPLTVTPSTQEG